MRKKISNNTIEITSNYTIADDHLRYAMTLSIEAANIEKTTHKSRIDNVSIQNRRKYHAFVTSSILLINAFLESKINEFFTDASNNSIEVQNDHEKYITAKLKESWLKGIPRRGKYSIFEKYQKALEVTIGETFNKGSTICQDIVLLSKLRNLLLHHESEIVSTKVSREKYFSSQDIEAPLKNRFKQNPFVAIGNAFFPDKCLSAGCACWGIVKAVEFVDLFFSKLGVSRYFHDTFKYINHDYLILKEIHDENEKNKFKYLI